MSLTRGTRLGPYEVTAPIGKGGMGEVYRARDTKLERDVAIKVLPDELAANAERVARFEREARLLASLNHPNIASIHGFETSDGVKALVLELIEGPTLAERIDLGPIPIDEAIAIAKQIAEALESGHEAGIIHRDLKPANIKVKEDGTVKVLDYGLAKALEVDARSASESDPSQSPTLTLHGTKVGVILGTAAYMSPEQAKGGRVDKRADVWAFGVVLYEMLCGRNVFGGDSVSETLARVLEKEPDFGLLPANTPASVQRLLRRCLRKAPKERLRDIGDARLELSDPAEKRDELANGRRPSAVRWIPWGVAVAASVAAFAVWALSANDRSSVRAFELAPPPGTVLRGLSDPASRRMAFALSPDGSELAFVARGDEEIDDLYLRSLGTLESRKLAGGARQPFWSPDGEHLGFFTPRNELMRVSREGGPPLKLANVGRGVLAGTWSRDGTILFSQDSGGDGLIFRIPDNGGAPEPVTVLDTERGDWLHRWPQFLPGGKTFLYFARNYRSDRSAVLLGSLDGHAPRVLFENRSAATYANGYLLFVVDGVLSARPFDPETGELGESIRTVAGDVEETRYSNAVLSASENGVIAYSTGGERQQLQWFDRAGRATGALDELDIPAGIISFQISPDDKTVAANWAMPGGAGSHIWLGDLQRGNWRRWTVDPTFHVSARWSPDGREIAYSVPMAGGIFVKALDANREPRLLHASGPNESAGVADWGPDYLIEKNRTTIVVGATGEVVRTLTDEGVQSQAAVYSPDGAWIAYSSSEGGDTHIFVQAALGLGPRVRVSSHTGSRPKWRRPDEIVYSGPDGFYAVPVTTQSGEIEFGEPRFLFAPMPWVNYDISRDHERLLIAISQPEPGYITVDTDWLSAIR